MNDSTTDANPEPLWLDENLRPVMRACAGGMALGTLWLLIAMYTIIMLIVVNDIHESNVLVVLFWAFAFAVWGCCTMFAAYWTKQRSRNAAITLLVLSLISSIVSLLALWLAVMFFTSPYGNNSLLIISLIAAIFGGVGIWTAWFSIVMLVKRPRAGRRFEVLPNEKHTANGAD